MSYCLCRYMDVIVVFEMLDMGEMDVLSILMTDAR
jgi:hypothetical protein